MKESKRALRAIHVTKIIIAKVEPDELIPVRCDMWLQSEREVEMLRKQQETLHSAYRIYFVVRRYFGVVSPEIQRKTRLRAGISVKLRKVLEKSH
jgi:hypothetical protein